MSHRLEVLKALLLNTNVNSIFTIISKYDFYLEGIVVDNLGINYDKIMSIELLPSGKKLLVRTINMDFYIWNMENREFIKIPIDFGGRSTEFYIIPFGDDNFLTNFNEQIIIWDTEGKIVGKLEDDSVIWTVEIMGSKIITKNKNEVISIWDIETRKKEKVIDESNSRLGLEVLSDNLIISQSSNTLNVWDINSSKILKSYDFGDRYISTFKVLSPNIIIVVLAGKILLLWNIDTNTVKEISSNKHVFNTLKISNNEFLVIHDDEIRVYNTQGTFKKNITYKDSVYYVNALPSGELALMKANDLSLWDLDDINMRFFKDGSYTQVLYIPFIKKTLAVKLGKLEFME